MKRAKLQDQANRIHREEGDALAGERIIAQARNIGKPRVVKGTSSHNMQEAILKSNVLCVIDKSFRVTDEPFTLSAE